jgi:hypothetical protein
MIFVTMGIIDTWVSCYRFRPTLLLQYALSPYRHYGSIDTSFVLRTLKSIYTKRKDIDFYLLRTRPASIIHTSPRVLCKVIMAVCFKIHHHRHHISVMELCHLLTRSALTYPYVSSKVCHYTFCQLGNRVSLPWVIYYEAFYFHVVSSFSCIPVICMEQISVLYGHTEKCSVLNVSNAP